MALMFVVKTIRFLRSWHFYTGRAPAGVPSRSVIFFPLSLTTLPCGLAGILTIKGTDKTAAIHEAGALADLFQEMKAKGMSRLLNGESSPEDYLGGQDILAVMDRAVLARKDVEPFLQLLTQPEEAGQLATFSRELKSYSIEEETLLEENAVRFSTAEIEIINSRLVILKDIAWALEKDILENIDKIFKLAGCSELPLPSKGALKKYLQLNFLLNCLDRLEVRGRDSAGIQINMTTKDPAVHAAVIGALQDKGLHDDFIHRTQVSDFINGAINLSQCGSTGTTISFVYKTASIIGELGRNVRELRNIISHDRILREFANANKDETAGTGDKDSFEVSLAHTRWASVGSITEENCHPINNFTLHDPAGKSRSGEESEKNYPAYGRGVWSISVVLNGDIDNYRRLRNDLDSSGEMIAPEVTTDTKIIPIQIEKYLLAGADLHEAFRLAVNDFEGSHAIAMISNIEPGKVFLALKGSGQAIYIGLAGDRYLFSSELYGLVEGTPFFIKMDGEAPAGSDEGGGPAGQIFVLSEDSPGGVAGIQATAYDGTPLPITPPMVQRAEITTRDIDRGDYPHYFLKEISEAGASVRKTLRGKYRLLETGDGRREVSFNLGDDIIPFSIRQALTEQTLKQIIVIGHGTAAVAGKAVADAFERYLRGSGIKITARIASELSGFDLTGDLKDTLIIPITQSGTTTDTNRAVAMAAERRAFIISIVNRRQSDITAKSDGVFYTSDGRDIEMSVASTKAFYSQIIAGHVLALSFAQLLKTLPDDAIAGELKIIEEAPEMMGKVLAKKDQLRLSAETLTRQKRYWAVVGSGPNKAAADEIRIKLSELCYKTISSDIVENKKHIDLSAEPLIIVCAAGSPPAVVGDIVKDVAIFKAHKAGIVVFADTGEERFNEYADTVIEIPRAPLPLPVILNTVAGHLWGYFAARSIDAEAVYLRKFRSRMNQAMVEQGKHHYSLYDRLFDRQFRRIISDFATDFHGRLVQGVFSQVSAQTIANIVLLLKYAVGKLPLEDFWIDFKEEEDFTSPLDLLDVSLGHAIDELSRPIDAIRHQAKTVTVGTSRKEEALAGIIFQFLRETGFPAKTLTGKNIMALKILQPAIADIRGYTLYHISNLDIEGHPTEESLIEIVKREGVSLRMASRVEGHRKLMGTKRTIASMGHIYSGFGRADGATIIIIPLLGKNSQTENLLLLHVNYREDMTVEEKKETLGYRYNDIRNMINEYNLPWTDQYLATMPVAALMGEPVEFIADQIR
ncbi:MAG: SIS domain-containing protein, partial [Syntrophus sp. (in: bacteria)]